MRSTASKAMHSKTPSVMRDSTAKLKPAPCALHLIASGVVDQIRITVRNAKGSGIKKHQGERVTDYLRNARLVQSFLKSRRVC
jgi:hypothetical protein